MHIDKKSPIPAYYQLKNIILQKIEQGAYSAGSLIPSERELSEILGISRMTVRQALTELVLEGVLHREKGKGTFISQPKLEQKNMTSFSETVIREGLVPTTEILHFSNGLVPEEIWNQLEIKPDDKVYVLRRLRLASGQPVGIEEDFIPEKYCPGFESCDLTGSLYRLLREEYGLEIAYADHIIESSAPSKEERELLQITKAIPVLKVTCVNYAGSHAKLVYERSVYRSDYYKYSLRTFMNKKIG
jgi:GntR family transcriptional regulator